MKSARQEILDKLKNLNTPVPEKPDFGEPVFFEIKDPFELVFKKRLEEVNGVVRLFASEEQLFEALKMFFRNFKREEIVCSENALAKQMQNYQIEYTDHFSAAKKLPVAVTSCECLVAQTGSVMVSSQQLGGRQQIGFPEIHVVIASKNNLVKTLEDGYRLIQDKYGKKLPSQITLITGPSRTADIEKTLTLGAHGPKELYVFLH